MIWSCFLKKKIFFGVSALSIWCSEVKNSRFCYGVWPTRWSGWRGTALILSRQKCSLAIGKPKSKVIPSPYSLYLRGVDPEWIQVDPSGSDCSLLTAIVGRYDVFGDRTFILGGHTQSPSGSEWIRPDLEYSPNVVRVCCFTRPQICHSRNRNLGAQNNYKKCDVSFR